MRSILRRLGCLAVLAAFGVVAAPTGLATAATLWVNDGVAVGGNTSCADPGYNTINAGITAAGAVGDTIEVCVGTYAENVAVDKNVTLKGFQAGVDAHGRVASESTIAPAAGTGIELRTGSAGSTIDGFTVSGGTRSIESTSGPIDGVKFLNNRLTGFTGSGFFLTDSGIDITIHQNAVDGAATVGGDLVHLGPDNFDGLLFTNNHVQGYGAGIGFFVDGNHNVGPSLTRSPLFDGNTIDGADVGANLGSRSFEYGTISNNTFSNNDFDGLQGGIQHTTIDDNVFEDNGRSGLVLTSFGSSTVDRGAQDTMVLHNEFSGNGAEGLFFRENQAPGTISTNEAHQNNFDGNNVGARYLGTETVNVDCNWWGHIGGPADGDSADGSGLDFTPWLTAPAPGGTCNGDTGDLVIDAAAAAWIASVLDSGADVTVTTSSGGSGTITVDAPIVKTTGGCGALTLNADSSVTINAQVSVSGCPLNINAGGDVKFQAAVSAGTMSVTADGAVTQSAGSIDTGSSSFSAGAHAITLLSSGNDFFGAVSLTTTTGAGDVAVRDANALTLGASSVGGDLTVDAAGAVTFNNAVLAGTMSVTAGGAVTQSAAGVLTVTGSSSFSAGAAISLSLANSFGGPVSVTTTGSNDVALTSASALTLGASSVGGDLAVVAGGALGQSGALTVGDTSSFSAGAHAITLTNAGNSFGGPVSLTTTGSNDAALTSDSALELAASSVGDDLTVVAGDALTQSGALTVGDTSSFSAGAHAITLTNAGNSFGGPVSLTTTGSNDVALTSASALRLAESSVGDDLTVVAGDALTQSGALTVGDTSSFSAGAHAITLLSSGNDFFGAVSLTTTTGAGDVAVRDANALTLGASSVGGDLTVDAAGAVTFNNAVLAGTMSVTAGGAVTQSAAGVLTVTGSSSFSAGAAISLSLANSFGGPVSVTTTGSNDVALTSASALTLGASSVGGDLAVVAGGALGQSGALTVGDTSSFSAGAHAITLTNAGNSFGGPVSLTTTASNNAALTASGSLPLGASSVGGAFSVSAVSGGVTISGAISASSFVTSPATTTSFIIGGSVTTTGAQIYNNAVSLQAGSTNLSGGTVTFNSTVDGAGGLTVTGNAVFNGDVGGTTALASLHVTGTSDINTCLIKTTGAQTYVGAVTTKVCTTLDGHPVTLNSTVNGLPIYQFLGFFSPVPGSKWKIGQTVPFKVALADRSGVRLSDSAAAALLTPCRVKISSVSLSLAPTCMKYDSAIDVFTFSLKLLNPGTQTVTVTLSYPGTGFTTTKSVTFTVAVK